MEELTCRRWSIALVVTSGAATSAEQIRAAVERAGFVLSAEDGRARTHDHAPGLLLATQVSELDNNEVLIGGVR